MYPDPFGPFYDASMDLDVPLVGLPASDPPAVSTAQVVYRFTVCGRQHMFTAETSVSGCPAEAAVHLVSAGYEDACDWLFAQTWTPPAVEPVKGLFGRTRGKATDRASQRQPGRVVASVEIDGVSHEYTGEVRTGGDPYRATSAALAAAKSDLWDWAWAQKQGRKNKVR